ncbi:MAG: quinohemoprotein amine dehydrogenase subunit beta [Azonexus sp.]|jgi:quinohemoprotein amine dehydrogenase beta subunit|nr:quinohemoprotein amine dehydrogenase subunit beta [Azonexus sp.]
MDKKTLACAALIACSFAAAAATDPDKALKAGNEYLITANYPDNLNVIDMQSDKIYKSCQLPAYYGPGTIQMSPDKKIAYILANHYADIYGIEVDSCKPVFHAALMEKTDAENDEYARSIFSMTVSRDGKEVYAIINPSLVLSNRYEVQQPRLQVYAADGGLKARPIRSFPAPRQLNIMQAADDGSIYVAGPNVYKVNVQTGKFDIAVPSRDWQRPNHAPPDVLYIWDQQTYRHDFFQLYSTARFKDDKQDLETADFIYGFFDIDLATGKTETVDFGPLTEIYFTGMRSPKDPNLLFTVLHRLVKHDIKAQKQLQAAPLDHTYYCVTLNKSGSKVYLSGTLNDIAVFDADKLTPITKITLPGGDMGATTTQAFIR